MYLLTRPDPSHRDCPHGNLSLAGGWSPWLRCIIRGSVVQAKCQERHVAELWERAYLIRCQYQKPCFQEWLFGWGSVISGCESDHICILVHHRSIHLCWKPTWAWHVNTCIGKCASHQPIPSPRVSWNAGKAISNWSVQTGTSQIFLQSHMSTGTWANVQMNMCVLQLILLWLFIVTIWVLPGRAAARGAEQVQSTPKTPLLGRVSVPGAPGPLGVGCCLKICKWKCSRWWILHRVFQTCWGGNGDETPSLPGPESFWATGRSAVVLGCVQELVRGMMLDWKWVHAGC